MTLSDDGWNPLHLATNSSVDLFRYLIEELGANPEAKNKNGVTVMHKAAFDNNNYAITYLRDKFGIKINQIDCQENTPLHFACSNGSEVAAEWLIGFGHEINPLNQKKETPLHLLLKIPEKQISTSFVRELILKGASRDLKDEDGNKPFDLSQKLEDYTLRRELSKMLGKQPTYLPCFHLKQPLLKVEKSKITMACFLILMKYNFAMIHLWVLPFDQVNTMLIPYCLLFGIVMLTFFGGVLKDPGFVKKS